MERPQCERGEGARRRMRGMLEHLGYRMVHEILGPSVRKDPWQDRHQETYRGRKDFRQGVMRVTFILNSFPRLPIGGYRVVYEYSNKLAELGHTVSIVHCRRVGGLPEPQGVRAVRTG